jgi:thymidine phosphorylase
VASGAGLKTVALVTAMDQPLAKSAGNAVEVKNAIDFLTGARRDGALYAVTLELGAEMLVAGGLAAGVEEGRARMEKAFASGAAAERFARMVAALGGPRDLVEKPSHHLRAADIVVDVAPVASGRVEAIDTRAIGLAVVALGGGRTRPHDRIDHQVGFTELASIGEEVGQDRPLGLVHARDRGAADHAAATLRRAYRIGQPGDALPPVIERIVG